MRDQNDSLASTNQELRAAIVAQLAAAGWTPIEAGTAIADKIYPTVVGPKEAQVYLADFGTHEVNLVLQGQYYSEGRNILAADSVLIPKAADCELARRLTDQFAAAAEATVLNSYAARLYQRREACAAGMEPGEEEETGTHRLRRRCRQCEPYRPSAIGQQ